MEQLSKPLFNIVALSGSLRENSSNTAILKIIERLMPEEVNYEIYKDLAQIPPFMPGTTDEDTPATIITFRQLLDNADALLICSPEYAFGVPGVLKNALDWTVYSGTLNDKRVSVITASSGGEKAHASLLLILSALGAKVADETNLLIPYVRTKINEAGEITDPVLMESIESLLNALLSYVSSERRK